MADEKKPDEGEQEHQFSDEHHTLMSPRSARVGVMRRIRNYFVTGLVIAAPLAITGYLVWIFIRFVDDLVKPLLPAAYNPDTYLPVSIPGVGLVVAVVAIIILGFLTANIIGRSIFNLGEGLLERTPLVRTVYGALKQIFQTVVAQSNNSFQNVGLIQYPRKGIYSLVFIATETGGEVLSRSGEEELYSVFLPTTPNPTSGFLLFVPRRDVEVLDMQVEDAAKMIISAGLVTPEYKGQKIEGNSEVSDDSTSTSR